jgi:pimeloyl-ACP methyl ester carboxylesterase
MNALQRPHEMLRRSALKGNREAPASSESFVRSGDYEVNDLEMRYQIHGAGNRTPLVTIPSFGAVARVFPSLTKDRQLIALETSNYAHSTEDNRARSFVEIADDIAALLTDLKIGQADFFGEGFGGVVAVHLAIRHPQCVRRVAIFGSALSGSDEIVQSDHLNPVAAAPPQLILLSADSFRIAWNGFTSAELGSIKAPVLIAAADHDVLGPRLEHHLEMSRLVPNAQLAVIPGAGHFVLDANPGKLLPIIATFLDEPTSSAPLTWFSDGW